MDNDSCSLWIICSGGWTLQNLAYGMRATTQDLVKMLDLSLISGQSNAKKVVHRCSSVNRN